MSIVTDFKSINKILDRKDPGTEHDEPFQGVSTGVTVVRTSGVSEYLPPFWSVPLDEALREFRNRKT